ncbi:hypothetical protein I3760_03G152900 [Carya illinoinensis]|nr:hypothetical protein I3760_03G152900 [Carya illinoinensis]
MPKVRETPSLSFLFMSSCPLCGHMGAKKEDPINLFQPMKISS